ncbi:hypothetical protein B0H16DRAFT_1458124 [Mycena metata]|uniref:Uncharacterized protein n=1 Tax=Mycena metata TaxID=1033252 RepID=A0AAD7J439_9AGAR|nr:hypothetical protein B0H16DRAFT_1458124 [Mycena metata]
MPVVGYNALEVNKEPLQKHYNNFAGCRVNAASMRPASTWGRNTVNQQPLQAGINEEARAGEDKLREEWSVVISRIPLQQDSSVRPSLFNTVFNYQGREKTAGSEKNDQWSSPAFQIHWISQQASGRRGRTVNELK